jgi:inorganic pyrophosphatase
MITVIVETPRLQSAKYVFDEKEKRLRFKKSLPLGMVFPYDFGMIPSTKAADGDPADAMVIAEFACAPGIEIECRLIGALLAEQRFAGEKAVRNDRYFFIPKESRAFAHIHNVSDFSGRHNQELEAFFVQYNNVEGKEFTPIEWVDADKAVDILKSAF